MRTAGEAAKAGGRLVRSPQRIGSFVRGDPSSGYYNDLRGKATAHADPDRARRALAAMLTDRVRFVPVAVAQLGLGAWQASKENPGWEKAAFEAAEQLAAMLDEEGRLWHRFPLEHTYTLQPPWCSAMAQGQAASLCVRVGFDHDEPALIKAGWSALRPLLERADDLVRETPNGPVLQEYPTEPASHVLNGWIFALWGLYDFACVGDRRAASEFDAGVRALEQRLRLYDVAGRWSRYDLYPHPLAHVASPFYHRLHVAQLEAMNVLADGSPFEDRIRKWSVTAMWTPRVGRAVTRKVAFRMLRPRGGRGG
jgi:hypothetical protein